MARLTAVEADYKRSQGKELFTKGFSIANISEMIGIGIKTLGKWREEGKLTLKCAQAIERGEPLPYKADDITKIVAAFNRITDHNKIAVYTMESLDGFTNFILEKAGQSTGKKRESYMNTIKEIRPYFDMYITELLQKGDD